MSKKYDQFTIEGEPLAADPDIEFFVIDPNRSYKIVFADAFELSLPQSTLLKIANIPKAERSKRFKIVETKTKNLQKAPEEIVEKILNATELLIQQLQDEGKLKLKKQREEAESEEEDD